jgi:sulfate permease, SulP family
MSLTPGPVMESFTPQWRLLLPSVWEDRRGYSWERWRVDLLAAATVAMVSIPQAVGFALIAGLPPAMVLTCVVVGGFVAALFFSSRYVVFGPSNSLSLLLAATFIAHRDSKLGPAEMAVVLALLIGVVQLSAGLFRLGQVTQFISRSVVIGYGAAIGALLVVSQVHHLLGVEAERGGSLYSATFAALQQLAAGRVNVWALVLAGAAFGLAWLLKRLRPKWPEALLVLLFFSMLARWLDFRALGIHELRDGGPLFASAPSFAGFAVLGGEWTTLQGLLGPAVAIAVLGMLEAVSIAKTYSARSGERVDTNRELVAMGIGNLATACFAGMPGSASFARSAANFQAGALTRCAGAMSSVLVLGFIVVLAPLVEYIPVPVLAVVLMRIGWRMIDFGHIQMAMRATGSDAATLVGTFLAALIFPLDVAIYCGVGFALCLALRKASTPSLVEYTFATGEQLTPLNDARQRVAPQVAIIHVEGEMFFGAAELFEEHVRRGVERDNLRVVILRMKNARHLDATTVFALFGLQQYFKETGRHLLISGVHGDVLRVIRRSGLLVELGEENVFPAELNPNLATRKALQRAQVLLDTPNPTLRIFCQTLPAT